MQMSDRKERNTFIFNLCNQYYCEIQHKQIMHTCNKKTMDQVPKLNRHTVLNEN